MAFAYLTDRKIKHMFEGSYRQLLNAPDYEPLPFEPLTCLVRKEEVEITHTCDCKEIGPILDPHDPDYIRFKKGEL